MSDSIQLEKESLIFYTTPGCHLCDQAKALYQAILNPEFFDVKEVDIALDDALIDTYGTRIPVIKRELNGKELGWPFDPELLVEFLSES